MHFEILVEDQSGKQVLDILVPRIIGKDHTYKIHPYKGIGRIPKNLETASEASKRILLDRLPHLLRGYGKTFAGRPSYPATVIVVCDLDEKYLKNFRMELFSILNQCDPKPETRFCVAIEEMEAWLLGDIPAIKQAFPNADDEALTHYKNDTICGTWEILADAVYKGGSKALSKKGYQAIGAEKSQWAKKICPYINVENNSSPSFVYFREKMLELTQS